MKIYIGKPRYHWISPYTILDYAFFWTDWSKCSRDKSIRSLDEESKYVEHPEWVEKWSDRLTPISKGIQWVLDKVHPEINYIKIDNWDVWSMDSTLSPIILPMLKQLQKVKHGSGHVDDEDVPIELRSYACKPKENEWDTDDNWHLRWDYVLAEMIWAFEQLSDDDNEQQFWKTHPEIDFTKYPEDEGKTSKPLRWKVEGECDWDAMKLHNERIDNGTRLFGKYYRGLWD